MPPDKGKGKQLSTFFRPKVPLPPPPSSTLTSDPFNPLPQSATAPTTPSRQRSILAVEIPITVLRPIAFRIFTKKHNLTLKSDALALLCSFVGRFCGADWRDSGAGEKLLDEVARQWKRNEGASGVLVDGGEELKRVIRGLEVGSGGGGVGDSREKGGVLPEDVVMGTGSSCVVDEKELEDIQLGRYTKVVDAFSQPKFGYNPIKKQFEKAPKPSLLPPPQHKTQLFRTRYNLLHQRLLRTELFLPPTFSVAATKATAKVTHKLTPISNLLGRSGQSFLLFGLLGINPSGLLTLLDPSGEIILDLSVATTVPEDGSWFTPGCFCIVDGTFEETGKFTVFTVGQPIPERREASAEVFGHVDFLGNGVTLDMSVNASGGGGQQGKVMRKAERLLEEVRFVFLGEVQLDGKGALAALRKVFAEYEDDPPLVVGLLGDFCAVAMGSNGGSVEYKEYFDQLASVLEDFPTLTSSTTFIFIPGDNDPWASTFSGGASTTLPRKGIPEIFTSRIKRVFTRSRSQNSSAIFASNPCRIGYFTQEIAICRDDIFGRFQRNGITFRKPDHPMADADSEGQGEPEEVEAEVKNVRKLVKTVLDQGSLSPFALSTRPVLWDYWHTLSLYPLPSALVLADPQMSPYAITYEGCHVMNPGKMVDRSRGKQARWVEYVPATGRGKIREVGF